MDTSTPAVTAGLVALRDGGPRALAERAVLNPRAHGELLVPLLREAAAEAGHRLADADAIVVGAGPGPFTGLRVGMATAAALGQALDVPVHPVCGLDAVALRVPAGESLLVAADARRKEVYWAAYDAERNRVDGPHVDRAADVPTEGVHQVAGEMAGELGLEPVEPRFPDAAGLVAAARTSLDAAPHPLVPVYLRRPDAAEPAARKSVLVRGER
nr:tRNA (adenosine(37)-N6)-threonylcarbamoyltransferase complex dimerization subunit type 1 TsaB [Saccharopolyspora sp. HNM0983]